MKEKRVVKNFFVLEGLDGVGKTTIGKGLRERGCQLLKTPTKALSKLKPIFENQDTRVRFMYYLIAVLHAGQKARESSACGKVVGDRYLLTTIAAHEAMGMSEEFMGACMPIINEVPIPEQTFILTASKDTCMDRMLSRQGGASAGDVANLEINDQILKGYRKWGDVLGHPVLEVDTTNMNPKEVVDFIENFK